MPAPLQLTETVADAIAKRVERGTALGHAAEAEGFSARVAWKWLAEGKAHAAAGVDSEQSRFMRKVARARDSVAVGLIESTMAGIRDPKNVDAKAALSALKTLCSTYYGDKALELHMMSEAESSVEKEASAGQDDPSAVAVTITRCSSCGTGTATDDPAVGARWCGGCGAKLEAK